MKNKPQKQTSKIILILSCLVSLFFIGCKNNEDASTPNLSQKESVVVKDGRLAFKNRTSYESVIKINPADTANGQKISSVALRTSSANTPYPGFISMLDVYNQNSNATSRLASDTMLINDPTLAALVNPDGIIEIGEWIFKINPAKSTVTVLNEADEDLYDDLVNDISNPKIYIFSTNDDILDLLESGQRGGSTSNYRVSILCGGGADASQSQSNEYTEPTDNRKLTGINAYKKFGIYFHLFTTAYLKGSKDDNLIIMHQHAFYYKTNCQNYDEVGPYAFSNYQQSVNYNYSSGGYYDFIQEVYMSTRGLHDYMLISKYGYRSGTVLTPLIEQH